MWLSENEESEEDTNSPDIIAFIDETRLKADDIVKDQGQGPPFLPNPYHSPEFADKLCNLCYDFTLWSLAILVKGFNCPNKLANSATVESDFATLKNRVL